MIPRRHIIYTPDTETTCSLGISYNLYRCGSLQKYRGTVNYITVYRDDLVVLLIV